ncbi:MAG: hypothetical protein QOI77_2716 [Blastocatellia bacterium]|jgi:hypothetical protein|nr:hypothetical protein [Blastocatellia bacterium]
MRKSKAGYLLGMFGAVFFTVCIAQLAAAQNSKRPDDKVARTTKRAIHEFTRSNSKQGPLSCEFVDRFFAYITG